MEKKDYHYKKPKDIDYIIAQFKEKIVNAPLGSLNVQDACFIILHEILWETRKQTKLLEYLCSDPEEKTTDNTLNSE